MEAVATILAQKPPRYAEEILEKTLEEQSKGFCSDFYTAEFLDLKYGCGGWRPLERFLVYDSSGKPRCIDNARKTLHNMHTAMLETIFTVSHDFVPAVYTMVLSSLSGLRQTNGEWPSWLAARISTDDLPDAYRAHSVVPSQQCVSIVAIYVPSLGWRFIELWGLAFGLVSAVVNFNRWPSLGIAISRRCAFAFAAAYFDDELAVEVFAQANVSRIGLVETFSLMGSVPQEHKGFPPAANRHYLGASLHVGEVFDVDRSGVLVIQAKEATRIRLLDKLDAILHSWELWANDAGKLRGDLVWYFSLASGLIGKLISPVLSEKQHSGSPALSQVQWDTVLFTRHLVAASQPRLVFCGLQVSPPVIVYSDASYAEEQLILGWVVFVPGSQPRGWTCTVPPSVISLWKSRAQQIFPGEALCGIAVPTACWEMLSGQDVLWFVDNEGACSALIRGHSGQGDVHVIAQTASLLMCRNNCRTWYEWIDTASNLSDGLSRLGLKDPWTLAQGWILNEFALPAWACTEQSVESLWSSLP